MTRPTKKHDGHVLTLVAGDDSLDAGSSITGVYRHFPRSQAFGFVKLFSEYRAVLCRDEWEVTHVWESKEYAESGLRGPYGEVPRA